MYTRVALLVAVVALAIVIALADESVAKNKGKGSKGKGSNSASKASNQAWEKFKTQHHLRFKNKAAEARRKAIWLQNHKKVNDNNKKNKGKGAFFQAVNHLSILAEKEFRQLLGARPPHKPKRDLEEIEQAPAPQEFTIPAVQPVPAPVPKPLPKPLPTKLPKSVDWRARKRVSPVRMQGFKCGSCAYHATIGALESAVAIKRRKMVPLSVQQAIDCLPDHCQGSYAEAIVPWVIKHGGVATQAAYPLNKQAQYSTHFVCKGGRSYATAVGYQSIAPNYKALMQWVAFKGPAYVVLNAGPLQHYKSGIVTRAHCPPAANHAVLVVGYGVFKGQPVWIVKNSWDTWWGLKGYVYIHRGSDNACGINGGPVGVLV